MINVESYRYVQILIIINTTFTPQPRHYIIYLISSYIKHAIKKFNHDNLTNSISLSLITFKVTHMKSVSYQHENEMGLQ